MSAIVKIISPIDGSVYAERPVASDAEVDAAVSRAQRAQADWARTPIAERARLCVAAMEQLLAMDAEIVPELAWMMGRPVRFGGERGGYEERVRYMAAIAEEALAPLTPPEKEGFRRYVKREPLGLVLAVAPWNYPYLTASNVVFPALIAGNALILKHASQTLLVGDRFQTAFDRAGAPAGVFQNVVLSHEQTERLLRSRLVDHVQFTGSVAGGKAMERAAAGTFATLGLELGGRTPLTSGPTPSWTTPSRTLWTGPSSIPARAAAESSGSMCTRMCTSHSSMASWS
jgi:acyl-CoA reductase-like NAD-dependent aldehyde dehydrogenase